jgi:hypothetical protein
MYGVLIIFFLINFFNFTGITGHPVKNKTFSIGVFPWLMDAFVCKNIVPFSNGNDKTGCGDFFVVFQEKNMTPLKRGQIKAMVMQIST